MSKQVDIEYRTVRIPVKIEVEGVKYPVHPKNILVVNRWETTRKDEILDELIDFSLDLGDI